MSKTKEKEIQKSSDILNSFLKQNSSDHYNFEEAIDYKISSGSLQLDLHLGGGIGPGLHRFIGMNEGGKEQPVSEPVLTPDGWVPIGSLKVGSVIYDSKGQTQTVLAVYPQGKKDVYEVVFNDGIRVRCGLEHLWETSSFNERVNGNTKSVKSLDYIKNSLRHGKNWNHSVRFVDPIEYPEQDLIIPPYLFGVLLNGPTMQSAVCVSDSGSEILDNVKNILKSQAKYFDSKIEYRGSSSNPSPITFPSQNSNPLQRDLATLGIHGLPSSRKFIPESYVKGSVAQRLDLLQGIIDSGGQVSALTSEVSYHTDSKDLCSDVADIARSLGAFVKQAFKACSYTVENGIRVCHQNQHTLRMIFPRHINPCTLKNKVANLKNRPANLYHLIHEVKLVGKEESVCIKVSSLDSLYVTRDYVLTHNTSSALSFMKNFLNNTPKSKGFYIKAEGRLSTEMQERSGVKFVFSADEWEEGTCFVFESNIYETVVDAMRQLVAKNDEKNVYYFLLDSVDGLISKGDLDKSFEESNKVAGGAVIAANFMKRLSIALAKRGHTAVFISQVRADIKLDPYTKAPIRQTSATGGNALLHFANWILEFEPRHKGDLILKNPNDNKIDLVNNPIIGHFAKVTIKKSPNEKTNMTIPYPIKYGRTKGSSIWVEKEVVDLLFLWEFLIKKASWITPTDEFNEMLIENNLEPFEKIQGHEALFSYIESKPDLSKFLINYFKKTIANEV